MLQTEIRREIAPALVETVEVMSLAEQAETLLEYSVLKTALDRTGNDMPKLARVLRDLDVSILNYADVEKYQTEHLREVAERNFKTWLATPARTKHDVFYCPRWDRTEIKQYNEPIPEFVLNKAVQIKQAYPDVKFYVEKLNESPDPFLIACRTEKMTYSWNTGSGDNTYDGVKEEYYIEVWAEPKFEGSL
jgi:hypothetical protein